MPAIVIECSRRFACQSSRPRRTCSMTTYEPYSVDVVSRPWACAIGLPRGTQKTSDHSVYPLLPAVSTIADRRGYSSTTFATSRGGLATTKCSENTPAGAAALTIAISSSSESMDIKATSSHSHSRTITKQRQKSHPNTSHNPSKSTTFPPLCSYIHCKSI